MSTIAGTTFLDSFAGTVIGLANMAAAGIGAAFDAAGVENSF